IRETVAIITLICAMLTTQAALGIVVVPLEIIGRTFDVENKPGQLSWFAAAYSLTTGTFILPSGRLGDVLGHKKLVVAGYAWTALWAMAAGLASYASTPVVFDICRGFQGVGYSLLLPNAVALLARTTHDGHWKRALYFTCFAATAPNGFILGACFSSLIAQFHPDRWEFAFYLAAICLAGLAVIAAGVLPSDAYLRRVHGHDEDDHDEGERDWKSGLVKWSRLLDVPGTVLAVSGLILFNFAWNQAAVVGWQVAYNPVLLVVGLLLIGTFLYWESRHATHPLIPKTIWTTRNSIVLLCVALGWSSFGIWNFYSVRWWIQLRGVTLLTAVAFTTPAGVAGIIAASLSVFLLSRVGPGPVMLAALCAFCAANALLATMPIQQTYWAQSFPSYAVAPLGMDMSFPSACLLLASALPQRHQGVAASVVNTVVNYSVALGLGIAGTVESHTSGEGLVGKWEGYRAALFLGTGLAGLGVVLALAN
ncbi:putative major facilitator superfamily transporter, partial [Jaminaea rosea]